MLQLRGGYVTHLSQQVPPLTPHYIPMLDHRHHYNQQQQQQQHYYMHIYLLHSVCTSCCKEVV